MEEDNNRTSDSENQENQETNQSDPYGYKENQETNQSYSYGYQENQETTQNDPYGYQQNQQQYHYQNQGYNQNAYGTNGSAPQYYKPVSGFAVASLVMGILSLLLACCSGVGGIAAGALGIIFAILSRKGQPMESQAKIGMGTSIAGLVLGVVIIIATFMFISTGRVDVQDELENELGRYGYEFRFGDDDDYDDYDDHYGNHYGNQYGNDSYETNEL